MLFVLAPELRNELPRVLGTSVLRRALSNLARAHIEGTHVLSGPADLLRQLGEAGVLPEDARGTFKQLTQLVFDAVSLRERVSHFAVIELRDGDIHEEADGDESRRCFRVPLAYFSDSAHAQASRLVAEDRDDAQVYHQAAKAYVHGRGPKGLRVSFQSQSTRIGRRRPRADGAVTTRGGATAARDATAFFSRASASVSSLMPPTRSRR